MVLKPSQALSLGVALGPSFWTSWAALAQRVPCCSATSLVDWVSILVTTPKMLVFVVVVRKILSLTITHNLTHDQTYA